MSDSSRPLVITKMQGAGNSFLLTAEPVPLELRAKITKKLCEVNFGIGADGMVFLGTPSSEVAEWDFYNSDGSVAEFCGNAARCAALFIFGKNAAKKKIEIKTKVGRVCCEIIDSKTVQVEMPKVEWLSKTLLTPFWPNPVCWLNTGVPHIVIEVPSAAELKKYRNEAAQIRSWSQLGPAGANVTFVHKHSGVQVSAVSFERGIENFTLACGTGAVAAASVIMANNHTSRCQVQMPGGDLQIELTDGKVLMTGEAHEIAQLTVTPAAFGWDCK